MWPFKRKQKTNPRYICPICLSEMTGDKAIDRRAHKACIDYYNFHATFGPHPELW